MAQSINELSSPVVGGVVMVNGDDADDGEDNSGAKVPSRLFDDRSHLTYFSLSSGDATMPREKFEFYITHEQRPKSPT